MTALREPDAVDAPETLDDAHRIPMDVEVDEIVAVLQVLTLADAVGGDEHVNLTVGVGKYGYFLLADWREEGEHGVEVELLLAFSFSVVRASTSARHEGGVKIELLLDVGREVIIEINRRVGKGGEDNYFLVIAVYGVRKLLLQVRFQLGELAVMRGCNG